jgi:hypothetical protein
MPTRRRTTLLLAALSCSVVLVAAGCGDDDSGDTPSTTDAPVMTTPIAPVTVTAGDPVTVTAPTGSVPTDTSSVTTTPPATTAPPTTTASSGADEEQVRAAVNGYIQAFLNADGTTACNLLTPSSQQEFVDQARQQGLTGSSCAELFTAIARQVPENTKGILRSATVGSVTVNGDTATGTIEVAGTSSPFTAERQSDGRWLLSEAIG